MVVEKIKEKAPKLSVVIASYQNGDKLYQALESVLIQSYKDFEIIVSDDGSESFDDEQIRKLTKGRRVKILCHETNLGTVRNLNDALLLCEGEWVLFMAADDILAEDHVLSRISGKAAETKKEWMIGSALLCDKNLQPTGRAAPTGTQMDLLRRGEAKEIWGCLCRKCFISSGGVVYRRDLLLYLDGFDTHYRLVEDWPLFLKLIREGKLPEVLDRPVLLHRSGGVSWKSAGRNWNYQRDLIETLHREIRPYLDMLSVGEKEEIETLCRDKEEIYQLRFETISLKAKVGWFLTHPGIVLRKITGRGVNRNL